LITALSRGLGPASTWAVQGGAVGPRPPRLRRRDCESRRGRQERQADAVHDRLHGRAGEHFWGRPTYVLQMPDGALLVSDEQEGAIYRASYRKG